jgi:hypothetical protein
MAIKNMLVPIGDIAADESAVGTALLMTQEFGGHADCLFVTGDVGEIITPGAMGLFETVQTQMQSEFMKEREKRQVLARQRFDDMLAERKIAYLESALPAELPSASWAVAQGTASEAVALRGGAYDLVVVGRPRTDRGTGGRGGAVPHRAARADRSPRYPEGDRRIRRHRLEPERERRARGLCRSAVPVVVPFGYDRFGAHGGEAGAGCGRYREVPELA